jgi:hypothetical protein
MKKWADALLGGEQGKKMLLLSLLWVGFSVALRFIFNPVQAGLPLIVSGVFTFLVYRAMK